MQGSGRLRFHDEAQSSVMRRFIGIYWNASPGVHTVEFELLRHGMPHKIQNAALLPQTAFTQVAISLEGLINPLAHWQLTHAS